ncbi:histidine kinase [Streptomyces sodiiphilus]|uniref:histidine kinase n=1 Tax=Streptomyces sodiiphilus TaxID=226217 RepID=A0ABP5A451_9ACTN
MPSLPRPHRHDLLIAGVGLAAGVLSIALGFSVVGPLPEHAAGPALIPLLAMCAAAALRRTAQPWALLLAAAAVAADLFTGPLLVVLVLFSDLVYAAVLYGPRRWSRALLPLSVVFSVAVTIAVLAVRPHPDALVAGVITASLTVAPAWTGVVVRDHRNAALAERLRSEQTALLAEMDRVQAVAGERARMARELHDVVANHLSAIAVHSTAALSLDQWPAARESLVVIRENSTQGLAEMRRLIGILRDPDAGDGVEIVPGPDGLGVLLDRARRGGAASGLRFGARDERAPGTRLPAPVELAAHRIVQESLTNAVKHAAAGEVVVWIRLDDGVLSITVTSPYGDRDGPRAPGSGAGLTGMRERAELLGGTFEAGRTTAGDSWRVRAELPVDAGRSGEGGHLP